jgi:hypothetical protein
VAIICASAPALHPLLVRIAPKFRLGHASSRRRNSLTPPADSLPMHSIGKTASARGSPKLPAKIFVQVRRSVEVTNVSFDGGSDRSAKNLFGIPWDINSSSDAVVGVDGGHESRQPSQASKIPIRAEV